MRRFDRSLTVLVIALLVVAALPLSAQEEAPWPTEAWAASTPEAQGMSSEELAAYIDTWTQPYFNPDSLIVIHNGYIIAEVYPPPYQPDIKHYLYSASKSVTGALIGILMDEGSLESLDVPVLSLFPDRTFQNVDANKEAMTVRDVLTMAAGLECHDLTGGYMTSAAMEATDDWLQFALDLPMAVEPGTELNYCNPYTHILSAIITEKTGMSALDYAVEKIFKPLGITDYAWTSDPTGLSLGYTDLQLTPRDMAKFGYLYLRKGEWDGQQIIPADYVEASLATQIETAWPDTAYGYQWWKTESINANIALGWAGQYIILQPDKDLMAVFTGGFIDNVRIALHTYPAAYSLAALTTSDGPLPENPEALSRLEAVIDAVQNPEPAPVPAPLEMAAQVSGQTYGLIQPSLLTGGIDRKLDFRHMTEPLQTKAIRLAFGDTDEAALTLVFMDEETADIAVGLDGLYRVTEGERGPFAARGEWLTEDTFRIDLKYLGDAFLRRIDVTFIPGAVEIVSMEHTEGQAQVINGMAAQ